MQREPLAVHPPTLIRAEERDRLGEVLAGVKVAYAFSGLAWRICGVRIALTTTMLAVVPVPSKPSAKARVQASAAALAAA